MMKNKPPCKDCSERSVRCHAECERYKAYAAEREEIRAEKGCNRAFRRYKIDNYNRLMIERFKRR